MSVPGKNELGPARRGLRREGEARHQEAGDQKLRDYQVAKRPRGLVAKWLRLYKKELCRKGSSLVPGLEKFRVGGRVWQPRRPWNR